MRDYTTMNSSERAALLGNELTTAVDAMVDAFACTTEQRVAIGGFCAAWLGRITSLYAGYQIEVIDLRRRVAELEAREAGGDTH